MYTEPDETAGPRGRFGGVDSHSDANPSAGRPGVRRKRLLGRDGSRHRVLRRAEHDEERIALGVDLPAADRFEGVTLQVLAFGQDRPVELAVLTDKPGRTLDVGEQHRHGARGLRVGEGDGLLLVRVGFPGTGHQSYPSTGLRSDLVHGMRLVG